MTDVVDISVSNSITLIYIWNITEPKREVDKNSAKIYKLILVDKTLLEKTFLHLAKYNLATIGYIYIDKYMRDYLCKIDYNLSNSHCYIIKDNRLRNMISAVHR